MKTRIYDSDGVFRGCLWNTNMYTRMNCRVWDGLPHPHFNEYLFDISEPDQASCTGSWFILRLSATPDLSGSEECDDLFDANSYALRISPVEAVRFLAGLGYDAPADLASLASERSSDNGTHLKVADETDLSAGQSMQLEPLTEALQEVWDLLSGRLLSDRDLAKMVRSAPVTADSIRKRIQGLNNCSRLVENVRGRGYFRPDAPPPD